MVQDIVSDVIKDTTSSASLLLASHDDYQSTVMLLEIFPA